jgi:membrane protease subunit (stomatin/prohibitin family)
MGIWDRLRGELVDIVEWTQDDRETIVWRFPRYENEIKQGAQLIVRESQVAGFVNEGQLTDLFLNPGTFTLHTRNLPILASVRGWKHGFESPFKAEVYFVSTRVFTDRKWGTKNPIMLRDAEFGAVRLRAFGTFAIKVSDPATLLKNVVGTDHRFTIDEIGEQLRNMVVARFADVLAESKIPVLDLAGNYDELGRFLTQRMAADFEAYGLTMAGLYVENISLPPEVEQALDKRTSMGVIGDLNKFAQYQTAAAIGDAARNPSGLAGAGAGLAAGMAMGGQMNQAMALPAQPPAIPAPAAAGAPPPPLPPPAAQYFLAVGGAQQGPLPADQLRQRLAGGQITPQTLAWRNGLGQWTALCELPEFRDLASPPSSPAGGPPPLPPAAGGT